MDLYKICPKLLVTDDSGTIYQGFLSMLNEDFAVEITLPARGCIEGLNFKCDWKLEKILQKHNALIQQRLKQSSTLAAFLQEVKAIVENELQSAGSSVAHAPITAEFTQRLMSELEQVGWRKVKYLDGKLLEVHFLCHDVEDRSHMLRVHLDPRYPAVDPTCQAELPEPFKVMWNSKRTLPWLVQQFEIRLDQYQYIWDCLDQIDHETWVIEPEQATRAMLHRRIVVERRASLLVRINLYEPHLLPMCHFFGAERVTRQLKENLNSNVYKWDPDCRLLDNLQMVLDTDFPSKSDFSSQELREDCGICFSYKSEGKIPSEICNTDTCAKPFHSSCLIKWLQSQPCCRQNFNVLFGKCPFCTKPISVAVST